MNADTSPNAGPMRRRIGTRSARPAMGAATRGHRSRAPRVPSGTEASRARAANPIPPGARVVAGSSAGVAPQAAQVERRRSRRIRARLVFEVYDHHRCLGRFPTRDLSQGGLFLQTGITEDLECRILRLRFHSGGAQWQLRALAVHRIPGLGVGVQLATWRPADQEALSVYRALVAAGGAAPEASPQ